MKLTMQVTTVNTATRGVHLELIETESSAAEVKHASMDLVMVSDETLPEPGSTLAVDIAERDPFADDEDADDDEDKAT